MITYGIVLLILFYVLGAFVTIIPSLKDLRAPKTKKLTKYGRYYIAFFFALFFVSILKDCNANEQNKANELARKNYEDTLSFILAKNDSIERINSKMYLDTMTAMSTGLVRSDTLQKQLMFGFMKDLDDWGLEIRDSNIVRKQGGTPLIACMKCSLDSIGDNYTINMVLCNQGTAEAFDVNMNFFRITNINNRISPNLIGFDNQNIGIKDCWDKKAAYSKSDLLILKDLFFVEGDYKDSKGIKKTFSFCWQYIPVFKTWSLIPTPM